METKNTLTLVGLPIGNIEDITLRAMKALFASDVILAEDTRNYLKIKSIVKERYPEILKHLGVDSGAKPELLSYREQNHDKVKARIITLLKEGKSLTFMSDAGMPGISDPGYRLIDEVLKVGFEVDVIPGPTAIETALLLSGLPTDRFTFLGFLPRQASNISKLVSGFKDLNTTLIIYESPFRLVKTLEALKQIDPNFEVAICNDLTKKFQKVMRGNLETLIKDLSKGKIQGEWVIVARLKDSR